MNSLPLPSHAPAAQDCCALCLANPKCNMFDWCDPAKVEKAGSSECFPKGVSGECALWQTSKGEMCGCSPASAGLFNKACPAGRPSYCAVTHPTGSACSYDNRQVLHGP